MIACSAKIGYKKNSDGLANVDQIDFSAFMLGPTDFGSPAFGQGPTGGGALSTGGTDPVYSHTGGATGATSFKFTNPVAEGGTSAAFWFTQPNLDITATGTDFFALGDRLTFSATTTVASSVSADIQVIPLPAAVWLFGSGPLGLAGMAKRKRC